MKRVSAEQSSLGVREASQATCCMTPVKARRIVAILTNSSRHALQQPNQGGRLGLHVQDPLPGGDELLGEQMALWGSRSRPPVLTLTSRRAR